MTRLAFGRSEVLYSGSLLSPEILRSPETNLALLGSAIAYQAPCLAVAEARPLFVVVGKQDRLIHRTTRNAPRGKREDATLGTPLPPSRLVDDRTVRSY
jgi:hypothetical protein